MLRWYYCKKKEDLALKSVMPVNAKRSKDDTETETVQKKRPPQTLLDNWLKRPSLSPDCLGALEPGASSVPEQSVPGSGTETVPLPLAHSSDASPRVSSPEPPHVLAGMIFAFAGVVPADEAAYLKNQVAVSGAQVRNSLDTSCCTHLVCDDGACAEAERARLHGIQIVNSEWVSATIAHGYSPSSQAAADEEGSPEEWHRIEEEYQTEQQRLADEAQTFSPADALEVPALKLPADYVDAWDRDHVRLPCSPQCVGRDSQPLWLTLCRHLSPPPSSLHSLLQALKAVKRSLRGSWRFDGLRELLTDGLGEEERARFFRKTLPGICGIALQLPQLCSAPIPLLRAGQAKRVELSADQCGSLLAHAFFCSLPFRNAETSGDLPYFSFCRAQIIEPVRGEGRAGRGWMRAPARLIRRARPERYL